MREEARISLGGVPHEKRAPSTRVRARGTRWYFMAGGIELILN